MDKVTRFVIGFDIGDRKSVAVSLDRETGEMRQLPAVATLKKSVRAFLPEGRASLFHFFERARPLRAAPHCDGRGRSGLARGTRLSEGTRSPYCLLSAPPQATRLRPTPHSLTFQDSVEAFRGR